MYFLRFLHSLEWFLPRVENNKAFSEMCYKPTFDTIQILYKLMDGLIDLSKYIIIQYYINKDYHAFTCMVRGKLNCRIYVIISCTHSYWKSGNICVITWNTTFKLTLSCIVKFSQKYVQNSRVQRAQTGESVCCKCW